MSTIKDLRTGAIFEVKLDDNLGFGYVKLIIFHDIDSDDTFNLFIVKPYNYYSISSIKKSFDPQFFETDDIICFPQNMYFRPKLRGTDAWNYIGMSKLTEEDLILPDYLILPNGYFWYEGLKKAIRDKAEIWIRDSLKKTVSRKVKSHLNIDHLGIWPHTGSQCINRFLSMYWMKEKGRDHLNFYQKYKSEESYYEREPYDYIGGGLLIMNRENHAFQQMNKVERLKHR
ncbi:hypothetical protein [Reichenbachiella versicolor]|uniref:hypothetical protein n=1 Tax=Reichenbachiella versicolor TaxID=1821036 RepID=UPI000D6DCE22|nr:hypothetical protein [Reichenbachiella versicolor]